MRWLFYPFTLLYQWVTTVRNFLYDKGWCLSTSFSLPVISVGNLTVGGTGKTPHIAYLIALLTPRHNIATLSRGYGRATKGFVKADDNSTAATLGDEPLQFYTRYGETTTVAVCESRVEGVKKLIENDIPSLVLLDDA
ncbi:MAG: tetraacyldisaccharide 4'-kinase, partial [Bacteroidota bacterium]